MGLFGKLFGSTNTEQATEQPARCSFTFGVEDVFRLKDTEDLVVVGAVKGTIRPGMEACISNPGDDEKKVCRAQIKGLEQKHQMIDVATDQLVAIRLSAPADANIKTGTVLFSEDSSADEVHLAYINGVGNGYVTHKRLELSETELAQMSISDLYETWSYFSYIRSQKKDVTEEEKEADQKKVVLLAETLIAKLLSAKAIYVVFNKRTGEPHMFSRTVKQDPGYLCTPPNIRIIPESQIERIKKSFPEDRWELRRIENTEDGNGIRNFLGYVFYLNGACGVSVVSDMIGIDASKIVEKPTYEGVPAISIPVTNPDLMRWMLLLAQLGSPQTEDEQLIYRLYYRFFMMELPKAKLLVPMKKGDNFDITEPDENGSAVLKEKSSFSLPTRPGKHEHDAVQMYTDWRRMQMAFGPEWDGMIQTIGGMIDVFDVALNVTQYLDAGYYIDKDTYEQAVSMAGEQENGK